MLASGTSRNAVIARHAPGRLRRDVFCLVSELYRPGMEGHKNIRNEDRTRPK